MVTPGVSRPTTSYPSGGSSVTTRPASSAAESGPLPEPSGKMPSHRRPRDRSCVRQRRRDPDGRPRPLERGWAEVGVNLVVLTVVVDRVAAEEGVEQGESFVEHGRMDPCFHGLAERAVLDVRRYAQADPDDHPAVAEVVERCDLLRQLPWPPAGERGDHGPDSDPGGPRGDRAEHDPGVEHRGTRRRVELKVVPEEEAVPGGAFGDDRELDQVTRISGVGHADSAAHAAVSTRSHQHLVDTAPVDMGRRWPRAPAAGREGR